MEKIIYIDKDNTEKVNQYLSDGWKFGHIATVNQTQASTYNTHCGSDYGAYVWIYKLDASCQNSETKMEEDW